MKVKITDKSEIVKGKADRAIRRYLEEAGIFLEGAAKLELESDPRRVDTGLLRNSITHATAGNPAAISTYMADQPRDKSQRKDERGRNRHKYKKTELESGTYEGDAPTDDGEHVLYIGTNVEYAIYVHEGVPSRKMPPNRFLKNAVEINSDQLEEKFKEIMKEEMG